MDNAFWENPEKDKVNCILEMQDDTGRETRQVFLLHKLDKDGNPNAMFEEVVAELGEKLIDDNTEERRVRKENEATEKKQRDEEHARARKLEDLFNYKMEVFETEEIKNSKNRKMKAKIRRARSRIEVDMWAMKLLEAELEAPEDGGEK